LLDWQPPAWYDLQLAARQNGCDTARESATGNDVTPRRQPVAFQLQQDVVAVKRLQFTSHADVVRQTPLDGGKIRFGGFDDAQFHGLLLWLSRANGISARVLSGNTDAFFHGPLVLHECVGLQLLGRQGR
jgi:hypothetical protein